MPEALAAHATAGEALSPEAFRQICDLMYKCFGIHISPAKKHLVISRLADTLRRKHLESYEDYVRQVLADPSGHELSSMVDALTTNYTTFFREPEHFRFLAKTVIPGLKDRASVRFWSAGCATGEEPFSLACCALEALGAVRPHIEIFATDISTKALSSAERGVYPTERFSDLPLGWKRRFLLRGEGKWEGWCRFKPEVYSTVRFGYLNLNEPFSGIGVFSAIFCRNVMIYFDQDARRRLIPRLIERLEPGGYLFPGHAESLSGVDHDLQLVEPAVYRKITGKDEKCRT